jgi:hypothetical protein
MIAVFLCLELAAAGYNAEIGEDVTDYRRK